MGVLPRGNMSAQAHLFLQSTSSISSRSILPSLRAPTPTPTFNRASYGSSCHTLTLHFQRRAPDLCLLHSQYLPGPLKSASVKSFASSMRPHTQSLKLEGELHGLQQCEMDEDGGCPQEHAAAGSIHLIIGPMFAGKTTALLKRVQEEARRGRNVAMVKSDKDTRYGLAAVVSHDGMQMPCWAVPSLASFRDHIGEEAYAKLDVIGIDEAQFLRDLCSFCQVAADHEGKTLIVAGLDGDFLRNRFGSILELVPLADSVVKLSSQCELCGKPAFFTFRKTDESKKEVIGGTDVYMPVCRQHYFSGKIAMETARTVLEAHRFLSLQCDNVHQTFTCDNVGSVHQSFTCDNVGTVHQ